MPEIQRIQQRKIHTWPTIGSKLFYSFLYLYIYVQLTYHVSLEGNIKARMKYQTGFSQKSIV